MPILPPTITDCPIPTPPVTTKAPVVGVVDAVEPVILTPEAVTVLPKALTPEST
jgi:hypothetical protein